MNTIYDFKPSKENVEELRREFPEGQVVELIFMSDPQAPPRGTKGTVTYIDDIGTIHIKWDNGSTLGVILGEDIIKKV